MVFQKTQLAVASTAALLGSVAAGNSCTIPDSWIGSNGTVNVAPDFPNGWLSPDRDCKDGQNCMYECKMGYERTSNGVDDSKCPPNAQTGCTDVVTVDSNTNGPLCQDGTLKLNDPSKGPCQKVGMFVQVESFLGPGRDVTVSKAFYPGTEDINGPHVTTEDGPEGARFVSYYSADYWNGKVSSSYYVFGPDLPAGYKAKATDGVYSNIYYSRYNFGGNIKRDGDNYRLWVNGETAKIEWWDAQNAANANNGVWGLEGAAHPEDPGMNMQVQICPNGENCETVCKMSIAGPNARAWVKDQGVHSGSDSSFSAKCFPSVEISAEDYNSNAEKAYVKFQFFKPEELPF